MANKVYQLVNQRILEELRSGVVPWQKPWSVDRSYSGVFHRNCITGKAYKGTNVILLSLACQKNPQYLKLWLTFKQAKRLKGYIAKNSKGQLVIYWSIYVKKNGKLIKIQDIDNIEDIDRDDIIPILRYYIVFNLIDLRPESLRDKLIDKYNKLANKNKLNISPIDHAEGIINKYIDKPPIFWDDVKAYYSPLRDEVHMPPKDSFISREEIYSTLFHELVHSTGHPKRLHRFDITKFDHDEYSLEELTAEIGCCYLLNIAGINVDKVFKNSVAYINGWYSQLSKNPKYFIWAASRAQKAADYILGIKQKID